MSKKLQSFYLYYSKYHPIFQVSMTKFFYFVMKQQITAVFTAAWSSYGLKSPSTASRSSEHGSSMMSIHPAYYESFAFIVKFLTNTGGSPLTGQLPLVQKNVHAQKFFLHGGALYKRMGIYPIIYYYPIKSVRKFDQICGAVLLRKLQSVV